jgi:hypothetical protein
MFKKKNCFVEIEKKIFLSSNFKQREEEIVMD